MKKLTKWLAAALAMMMLAATLTACGGGGGSSAEIDGPGVSNATTQALEDAWLAKYNSQFNSELDNTLQKQAEDLLRNALAHMDPETKKLDEYYIYGVIEVNESRKKIYVLLDYDGSDQDSIVYVGAYTEEQMMSEIQKRGFGRCEEIGFAVLEYEGLYYWAWASIS